MHDDRFQSVGTTDNDISHTMGAINEAQNDSEAFDSRWRDELDFNGKSRGDLGQCVDGGNVSAKEHVDNANNTDADNKSSPRRYSSIDDLVISPASSSLCESPPQGFSACEAHGVDDDEDGPINPFRLDFENEQNNFEINRSYHSSNSLNGGGNKNQPLQTMIRQNNGVHEDDDDGNNGGRTSPTNSLSLSVLSGYDTEEDEDGVLRRYGSHVLASTKNAIMGVRSDDDEDSVYSAINQSADIAYEDDDAESNNVGNGSTHNNSHHSSNRARLDSRFSRSSSSSGGGGNGGRRKQKDKGLRDRIRDVINGMRRAHEDARLHRSTRRFLAMSEGQRTAQGWTESVCLSPWCDFTTGRGVALMFGALTLCVMVAGALGKGGHLGWGIWIGVIGIVIILIKVFWVPIHWLVVGQFMEQRRRRNMQVYDNLNGENPGGVEIPVQDFEREREFSYVDGNVREDTVGTSRDVV